LKFEHFLHVKIIVSQKPWSKKCTNWLMVEFFKSWRFEM